MSKVVGREKLYRTLSKFYPLQPGTRIPDTDSVQKNGSETPVVRHMKLELLYTALCVSVLWIRI
jgi:hypothetical protein